jgi:hypothetical protein
MDITTDYPTLIKSALSASASLLSKFPNAYEVLLVFDDKQHQYLLRKLDWIQNHHIRQTVLHVALKNGKIWIEKDGTETGIATYFFTRYQARLGSVGIRQGSQNFQNGVPKLELGNQLKTSICQAELG